MDNERTNSPTLNKALLLYFWKYIRPDIGILILTFGGLLLQSAFSVLVTLVPTILESNWTPDKRSFLMLAISGVLLANLVVMAVQTGVNWLMTKVTENVVRRVQLAIFKKVGALPSEEMSFQVVGKFAQRTTGDVMRLGGLVSPGIPQALFSAMQLVFMMIALFWIDWRFAWLLPLVMFGVWKCVDRVNERARHWARQDQVAHERVLTQFIESIGGVRDLVASGRFDRAATSYDTELAKKRECVIMAGWWNNLAGMVPTISFSMLIFGYYLCRIAFTSFGGKGEVGSILSYAANLLMAQGLVLSVFKLVTEAELAAPSLFELRRLLDAPEVVNSTKAMAIGSGEFIFKDVTFGYGVNGLKKKEATGKNESPKSDDTALPLSPIIDKVNFKIKPGSFSAIVGQSGSGKSTLFYMMLRLLEPVDGNITLGGVTLDQIPLATLRDYVGFIPQAPFIFSGTIKENLLMGVPEEEVPAERIEHAVQMAKLGELIEKRKAAGGLDAPVGAGGASLSAGERQRIALARIFLRKPGIIVCDEYTANIDNATAKLIQNTLKNEFAGITRIVITHQLYTVRGAECIFVLDEGKIVEQGTHDDLIKRDGLYKEMWEVQQIG